MLLPICRGLACVLAVMLVGLAPADAATSASKKKAVHRTAAPATPYDLKGVVLGMSRAAFVEHFGGHVICPPTPHPSPDMEICRVDGHGNSDYDAQISFAGKPAYPAYVIHDDKVVAIVINILKSKDYEEVLAALTLKWGKPTITDLPSQNGFGAMIHNTSAHWDNKVSEINLTRFDPDVEYSSIYMYETGYAKQIEQEHNAKTRAASDDM